MFLSITFLKLRRKYTEDILGVKGAKCFVPKQVSVFFFSNVSSACLHLSWKELLTVDANQNFQWLKFVILRCLKF